MWLGQQHSAAQHGTVHHGYTACAVGSWAELGKKAVRHKAAMTVNRPEVKCVATPTEPKPPHTHRTPVRSGQPCCLAATLRYRTAPYLIAWVLCHKAVIINGEHVAFLADHEPKAAAGRVLEADAPGLVSQRPLNVGPAVVSGVFVLFLWQWWWWWWWCG